MSSKKASVDVIFAQEPPPGPLGTFSVMAIALGSQLGIGLISFLPTAISTMGTRAWFIFPIIILLTVVYTLPLFFMSATVRTSAGASGFICAVTKNPYVIGLIQATSFFLPVYMAIFALGFTSYLSILLPGINAVVAGVLMITAFYAVNLLGTKWMARIQNIMLPILLTGLALYIAFAFANGDFSRLSPSSAEFSVGGSTGFITGSFLLFAMSFGYSCIATLGRVAKDAKKNIPHGYLICVAIVLGLFFTMGAATAIAAPIAEIGGTLIGVVARIFPTWLFVVWMIAVPGLLIATSVNGFFGVVVEALDLSARQGWLPISWTRTNKRGTKVILLTVIYVIGCIPVVTGWSVSDMASYYQFITFIAEIFGFYYIFKLPTSFKEAWEKSKFHVPDAILYIIIALAIIIKCVTMFIAAQTMNPVFIVFTLGYIAAAFVWVVLRVRSGKAQIVVGCWGDGVNLASPEASSGVNGIVTAD
ncbi:MAG: hypothetical protein LBU32_16975 [Clostridiales bacterium]|jgi:APA family basic amino acid/polyamine antiporter|nr:hypothetical protein [Clostridiales bacterium]